MILSKHATLVVLLLAIGLYFIAAPVAAKDPWTEKPGKGKPLDTAPTPPMDNPTLEEQVLMSEALLSALPLALHAELSWMGEHTWSDKPSGGPNTDPGEPNGPYIHP